MQCIQVSYLSVPPTNVKEQKKCHKQYIIWLDSAEDFDGMGVQEQRELTQEREKWKD